MYDYKETMREDIINSLSDYFTLSELVEALDDPYGLKEKLNDDLWIDDSVTGNGSGSYFFNSYKSREAVLDDMDACLEMIREYDIPAEEVGKRFLNEEWEWFDVSIRCYYLYSVVDELVDDLTNCREALEAESNLTTETVERVLEAA